MAKTCTKDGHKQTTKTSTKIQTKRTKKHRKTKEEMEGPTSSGGSRNRLTYLTLQEHDDDDELCNPHWNLGLEMFGTVSSLKRGSPQCSSVWIRNKQSVQCTTSTTGVFVDTPLLLRTVLTVR